MTIQELPETGLLIMRRGAARTSRPSDNEIKAQRVFRANTKTAAERARDKALREKLQKEKPSLEDLISSGAADPDAVMTMGMYFDVQGAL